MRVVNSQFATVNYNCVYNDREHLFASASTHFLNRSVMPINGGTGSINFATSYKTLDARQRFEMIRGDTRDRRRAIVAATRLF